MGYPAAYLLTLRAGLGVTGLWAAMSLAWAVCSAIYVRVLARMDWAAEAAAAQARLRAAASRLLLQQQESPPAHGRPRQQPII